MNASADSDLAQPPAAPTFDVLELSADLRTALAELGYVHPTPVQLAVFEPACRGRNMVVQARTGTGKTAAFGLPIVDALVRKSLAGVQALVLTPTRELALQVCAEVSKLAKFKGIRVLPVYGGAPMGAQIDALKDGVQVVVGTPGRVLDHLRRGTLDPKNIRIFVLDEADEMLSMGFAKELHAIIETLPKDRQGLYFSATIPPDIERLAQAHLTDPEWVALSSDQVGALEIQHFTYVTSTKGDKRETMMRVLDVEDPESAIVFCNTKDETERLAEALQNRGFDAASLNGDMDQREREKVMSRTREGKLRFLVATDVAARGIDVSHVTHVINYDFPESTESYVHRTGRTGRAGRTGTAISLIGPKDLGNLYLLRLTYKIRPIERSLPTSGELRTREETDLVNVFLEAFADEPLAEDLSLARRLLTHERAEQVIAGLLRGYLGAKGGDAPAAAAEARRAKNPPPVVVAAGGRGAPPPAGAPRASGSAPCPRRPPRRSPRRPPRRPPTCRSHRRVPPTCRPRRRARRHATAPVRAAAAHRTASSRAGSHPPRPTTTSPSCHPAPRRALRPRRTRPRRRSRAPAALGAPGACVRRRAIRRTPCPTAGSRPSCPASRSATSPPRTRGPRAPRAVTPATRRRSKTIPRSRSSFSTWAGATGCARATCTTCWSSSRSSTTALTGASACATASPS
jgi:ATP-dependent RNA helicase DeaD